MVAWSEPASRKEPTMEHKTGDKPGEGAYRCKHCGYVVRLASDKEALPACPNCGHHEFEKVKGD